ncbi:large ribosomal subunit protein uL10c [Physcomitrium patens]|uniref:Large ribosomal subunit protein uL10c n=1 Tax=Physcomitrium patens TaxID=3218 RepID=A9TBU0_PHYPA|nr:50S ribosomal protein L10, chloroplastic-like [Physcomitrium patens]PNR61641.1 hypothetical protein PHYPA_000064 [Physcomitrium patens]|eukprot:XP_024383459.1 50S ribosomal protein L10, chloroplastic-like [Physcomitrella patens]
MATQQAIASCGVSSEFWGSQGRLKSNVAGGQSSQAPPGKAGVVRMAISRKKKEETVEAAKQQLEGCQLVAGIKFTGLTVKQMQQLRKSLPQETTLMVAKNKLIGKAIEGTEWEALKPALKGMNAWLFVHTEEIPGALKPYRDLQKELKLENDYTGAVFEGKFYSPEEFKALESMPTRAELYSKLLGTIQAPAAGLVSTLQAPARDLVFTLKAYVKKLEDEA